MYVCNTYRAGAAPDDEKSLPEVKFIHTESLDINLVGSLQLPNVIPPTALCQTGRDRS